MLDGDISLDEIKERFEDEFPPQKITLDELQQFLGMLHRSGLVVADVPGQGRQLRKRRDERKRKELLQRGQQHPLHPLQGLRSRAVPELALSLRALVLLAAGGDPLLCCSGFRR